MHEKLREAAAALREAAEDCLQRAARYIDIADRLDDVTANLQPSAAAPAAKRSTPRRGTAPKAGRKAKGKTRRVTVAIAGKKLADAVTANIPPTKPNGKGGHPESAPDKVEAAPPAPAIERTPAGRIPRGSLDTPIVRYVTGRPGIGPVHVAEHFKVEAHFARTLLKRLVREGRLERQGAGYHPVETEASVQ